VQILVGDTTLRLALSFVAEDAGYVRRDCDDALRIVDLSHLSSSLAAVVVVDSRPALCRYAVSLVSQGRTRGVLAADEPEHLVPTLAAVQSGLVVLPHQVIERANAAPLLRPRQARTLQLVLAGLSNSRIADHSNASISTIKRDIAELLEIFDAPNRLTLASTAVRMGYASAASGP
jgi:DNA-binding NarL/FixJ family response regulator